MDLDVARRLHAQEVCQADAAIFHVEQCSKPLLVDDFPGDFTTILRSGAINNMGN